MIDAENAARLKTSQDLLLEARGSLVQVLSKTSASLTEQEEFMFQAVLRSLQKTLTTLDYLLRAHTLDGPKT